MKHKIQSLSMITLSTFIMAVGVYFLNSRTISVLAVSQVLLPWSARSLPISCIQFYLYRQYHPVSHRLYLFRKILCHKDDLCQYALIRLIGLF